MCKNPEQSINSLMSESVCLDSHTLTLFLCVSIEFMLHSINDVPYQQELSVLSTYFRYGNKCPTICRTLRRCEVHPLHPAGQRSSKLISKKRKKYLGKTAEKSVLNGLSLTSLQNTCSSIVDKQTSPEKPVHCFICS